MAKEGKLVGLVTVKDVLRHEAALEHKHSQTSSSAPSPLTPNGAPANWRERMWSDEDAAGLEVVLEEAFSRMQVIGGRVYEILDKIWERYGGPGRTHRRTASDQRAGFASAEYELQAEDH